MITALIAPISAQIPIADVFDLQKIGREPSHPMNGHYELTTSFSAQSSLQWEPIGTGDEPFTGTFDGKGYTISNLQISRAANAGHVGLFGYVGNGATIPKRFFLNIACDIAKYYIKSNL